MPDDGTNQRKIVPEPPFRVYVRRMHAVLLRGRVTSFEWARRAIVPAVALADAAFIWRHVQHLHALGWPPGSNIDAWMARVFSLVGLQVVLGTLAWAFAPLRHRGHVPVRVCWDGVRLDDVDRGSYEMPRLVAVDPARGLLLQSPRDPLDRRWFALGPRQDAQERAAMEVATGLARDREPVVPDEVLRLGSLNAMRRWLAEAGPVNDTYRTARRRLALDDARSLLLEKSSTLAEVVAAAIELADRGLLGEHLRDEMMDRARDAGDPWVKELLLAIVRAAPERVDQLLSAPESRGPTVAEEPRRAVVPSTLAGLFMDYVTSDQGFWISAAVVFGWTGLRRFIAGALVAVAGTALARGIARWRRTDDAPVVAPPALLLAGAAACLAVRTIVPGGSLAAAALVPLWVWGLPLVGRIIAAARKPMMARDARILEDLFAVPNGATPNATTGIRIGTESEPIEVTEESVDGALAPRTPAQQARR